MDFFTRLAERTLGLTPRVQPILGSRFAQAPIASIFPNALGEEQASAPQRPTDSTHAPTHRSRERSAAKLEPIAPDGVAKTHATLWETSTDAKAILQSDATSGFEVSGKAHALAAKGVTDPMPLFREGLDFPQEPVRPPVVLELPAEAHTTKAVANEPFSRDAKTGLVDSTSENNISRLAEDLHGRRFLQPTVRSMASLEHGRELATSDSLLLPFDPIEPSNQSVGRHTQSPRAESDAAIEFQSQVQEGTLEKTTGGSKVFVRPRVESIARRTEDAHPQPEANFDHGEPTRSSNDSAPPVIRVHIGRIEVRAILPPARAVEHATPALAKPNLSLDDYLKHGEKGPK